jgi:superfamily II DNA or RNA helicase
MTIQPREYQLEALDAILFRQKKGVTRQLCVLPTGCGKTIVFGLLAKKLNVRTLILAHREQLIKQAVDKVSLVWPEASIGVCMAERDEIDSQVVVASIQSASRTQRLARLKEQGFRLCVIDEAHHAPSASYTTFLSELGFLNDDPGKLLAGMTATATRQGIGFLKDIFQEVVFERSIGTMIKADYLSDLKGKRILTSANLDGLRTNRGDFVKRELAEVCNTPKRNALIVNSFLEHCSDRKGIAFTCDVRHAIDLASSFKEKGVSASAIYGSMNDEEKASIMDDFSFGKLQLLVNCALFTEGFDEPSINAVLMCRPTRSKGLYVQCVGRGTRLHPGKSDCLVLDFCDNFHDIQSIATLEKAVSLTPDPRSKDEQVESASKDEIEPRKVFVGYEMIGDFDLIDRSRFAWAPFKEHWYLVLAPNLSLWLKKEDAGFIPTLHNEDRLEPLVSRPIPLDYAMGLAEDWVRRNKDFERWACKDSSWGNDPPTEKQIEILKKFGCDSEGLSKGEATQLIGQKINEKNLWRFEPATTPQRFYLESNGVRCPQSLTKGEAMTLISKIKEEILK